MNKYKILVIAALVGWVIISSCTKDKIVEKIVKVNVDPIPDSLGIILAGAKGSSKTWSLTSATVNVNGGVPQAITDIPACESDNIFQFSNNSTQDYQQTEGATLCASTDPTTIEKGSWAFTGDGKSLLIDGYYYPASAQFQAEQDLQLFILVQGVPLSVVQMSTSSFAVSYSYTDTSGSTPVTYKFNIGFTKI